MKEEVIKKIKDLKNKKYGETVIKGSLDGHDYALYFLTSDCSEDAAIMELLSAWRKKHEFWFAAQFEVTVERTTSWFKEKVIGADDRLLFIIKIGDKYIGHIGLFRFDFNKASCEIDNIVRGEDGFPGVMGDAISHMMDWGRKKLGLKSYTLQTTSDNLRAIKLYESLGFEESKRVPLVYVEKEGQKEWIPAPDNYVEEVKRYDVFMYLKK